MGEKGVVKGHNSKNDNESDIWRKLRVQWYSITQIFIYIYMCQWLEIKKYNAQCERFLKNWKNCQTDPR